MSSRATSRSASARSCTRSVERGINELSQLYRDLESDWAESQDPGGWSGWDSELGANLALAFAGKSRGGKGANVVEIMQRGCRDQRRKWRQIGLAAQVSGGRMNGQQTTAESSDGRVRSIPSANTDINHNEYSLGGLYSKDFNGKIRLLDPSHPVTTTAERRPTTPCGGDVVQAGAAFAQSAAHRWGRRSYTPPKTTVRSRSAISAPDDSHSPSPHRHVWPQGHSEEAYSRRRGWRNSNGIQEKVHRERPVRLLMGLKKGPHAIKDLLAEIVVDDGVVAALSHNLAHSRVLPFQLKEGDAKIIQKSGKSNANGGLFDEQKQTKYLQNRTTLRSWRNPFAATHLDHFFVHKESPQSDDGRQRRIPPPHCLSEAGGRIDAFDFPDTDRPLTSSSVSGLEFTHSNADLGLPRRERKTSEDPRPATSAGFYSISNEDSFRRGCEQRGSSVDEFFIPRPGDRRKASCVSSVKSSRGSRIDTVRAQSSPGFHRGLQITSLRMPPRSAGARQGSASTNVNVTRGHRADPAREPCNVGRAHPVQRQASLLLEPWNVTPQSSGLRVS